MVTHGASYEVLAVRYGTRSSRRREVFLNFDLYGEPDRPLQMDYYFWIARNADRVVLIDCGFNEGSGGRRNRTMLCPPVDALGRLGVEAGDVSHLIVTHGHYDHIGNLAAFPDATILISSKEVDFWTGPMASKALFAHSAEPEDLRTLETLMGQDRVALIDASAAAVVEGIDVRLVGGHTPGQLVVDVQGHETKVVLASDALHYYVEMDLDRPFAHVVDVAGMYAGFEILREAVAAGSALVAGHDPAVMDRFPGVDGAFDLAARVG